MLVTGAAGMVGSSFCKLARQGGYTVLATDLRGEGDITGLDVCNVDRVRATISEFQPDLVVHLAAETDVDKCELEPDFAYRTNTLATESIALACRRSNLTMLYVSTIGVFDGTKLDPYTEFDTPHPINAYGKSKLEGEYAVRSLVPQSYVVRAGWMIGGGPTKDKKFVGKIVRQLGTASDIRAVDDKIGSLTYTQDLSRSLLQILRTERYGLYHCTNRGSGSRYDVARKIVEILGTNNVRVIPVGSEQFPLPAPRPRSEASINYKLQLLEADTMRAWEEALADYLVSDWGAQREVHIQSPA